MVAEAIDEVVADLSEIVEWARSNESRVGFFAAMYRTVTRSIQDAIRAGEFDDAERMTRLDVVFARRYIDAFADFRSGVEPTRSWQVAFNGAGHWRPIIIQQLLTGMNAHINLDLGIAGATVAPVPELAALEDDFNVINAVLGRMVDGFVDDVAAVSPWISVLDRIGGRADDAVIKFSIDVARSQAWQLAVDLAPLPHSEWQAHIDDRDRWTASFGERLLHPGWLSTGLLVIRLRESDDVKRVMDALAGASLV